MKRVGERRVSRAMGEGGSPAVLIRRWGWLACWLVGGERAVRMTLRLSCPVDPSSPQVVFLPCRHAPACGPCAARLDACPMCRGRVADRVSFFLP